MAEGPSRGRTLVDKIWRRHQMTEVEGERLLYVDYLLLHEGARHAFDDLEAMGRSVFRPQQVIACADHYVPTTSTRAGTILVRGLYGRGGLASVTGARVYAARGYHVVLQSVRGTFGSGGEFTPGRHEADDGADTVTWLRTQPWFTGRFATMGSSYLGYTQWALLVDPPPELATAIISVGPHDMSAAAWAMMAPSKPGIVGRLHRCP